MCYTLSMKGILQESTIESLKGVKNVFRNIAIWTLIGGIVLGGILIMFGDTNSSDVIGRIMGTFFVLGLAMLVSTIAMSRLDNDNASVQAFALLGLISNAIWFILWTILIWITGQDSVYSLHYLYSFATTFSALALFGLVGSLTLGMFEGDKKNIIRPLKITSVVCFGIVSLHSIISSFILGENLSKLFLDETWARFSALAGFTSFAWLITLIIAGVNSSSEKTRVRKEEKKAAKLAAAQAAANAQAAAQAQAAAPAASKTDDELRAEIEEQVRREMIEKEVRARLAKELKKK